MNKLVKDFAHTHWEEDDLREALELMGELPTDENVLELFKNINPTRLVDAMVDAGWDYLNNIVWETFHNKED